MASRPQAAYRGASPSRNRPGRLAVRRGSSCQGVGWAWKDPPDAVTASCSQGAPRSDQYTQREMRNPVGD